MKWLGWALLGLGGGFAVVKLLEKATMSGDAPPFPYVEVSPGKFLTSTAGNAFVGMRAAANQDGVSLPLTTAWRSPAWQQRLYEAWIAFKEGRGPQAPMAARPGTSLHEKGIAFDVEGVNPAASNYNAKRAAWLKANAARFGFYNTGAYFSSPEPWHFAYGVQREGGGPLVA